MRYLLVLIGNLLAEYFDQSSPNNSGSESSGDASIDSESRSSYDVAMQKAGSEMHCCTGNRGDELNTASSSDKTSHEHIYSRQ